MWYVPHHYGGLILSNKFFIYKMKELGIKPFCRGVEDEKICYITYRIYKNDEKSYNAFKLYEYSENYPNVVVDYPEFVLFSLVCVII